LYLLLIQLKHTVSPEHSQWLGKLCLAVIDTRYCEGQNHNKYAWLGSRCYLRPAANMLPRIEIVQGVKSQLDGTAFIFGLLSTNYLTLLVVVVLEYRRFLSQTVFALMNDIINRFKSKEAEKNETGITTPITT